MSQCWLLETFVKNSFTAVEYNEKESFHGPRKVQTESPDIECEKNGIPLN